jgi:hypothetical protein
MFWIFEKGHDFVDIFFVMFPNAHHYETAGVRIVGEECRVRGAG